MNTKTNNWVHIIKSKNNNSRKSSNRFKKDHEKIPRQPRLIDLKILKPSKRTYGKNGDFVIDRQGKFTLRDRLINP